MSKIQQVNRRDFVKLIGLASGGILLGCNVSSSQKEFVPQEKGTFTPNLFIQIQKDGTITFWLLVRTWGKELEPLWPLQLQMKWKRIGNIYR